MNIQILKLADLKPAEYNPRIISEEEFEGLTASLNEFGIVEPIVVNSDLTVIGGHQRLQVLKHLGYEEVECNVVNLNKHQEKKLNILLNSGEISGNYDHLKLDELLEELKLDSDYTDLRLDRLESIDLSKTDEEETDEKVNADEKEYHITCPECGHKFEIYK